MCIVQRSRNTKSPKSHHDTIKYGAPRNFDKDSFIYDPYTTPWTLLDMSENVNDELDTCTNSRQELRRNCSPIGHNNTKHFCAQSGASIRLTVWKWSGESRYPRALPPVLENFRRAFSPSPTDCPWVSEDVLADGSRQIKWSLT